jgi:hypothetical protein
LILARLLRPVKLPTVSLKGVMDSKNKETVFALPDEDRDKLLPLLERRCCHQKNNFSKIIPGGK